jgi:hypothetical protein
MYLIVIFTHNTKSKQKQPVDISFSLSLSLSLSTQRHNTDNISEKQREMKKVRWLQTNQGTKKTIPLNLTVRNVKGPKNK